MIICLGPICFPIWHLLPVLLLLFTKAKVFWYWMLGKPMPVSDKDAKKIDGEQSTKATTVSNDGNGTLRRRKTEGVIALQTVEEWKELVQVPKHLWDHTCAALVLWWTLAIIFFLRLNALSYQSCFHTIGSVICNHLLSERSCAAFDPAVIGEQRRASCCRLHSFLVQTMQADGAIFRGALHHVFQQSYICE